MINIIEIIGRVKVDIVGSGSKEQYIYDIEVGEDDIASVIADKLYLNDFEDGEKVIIKIEKLAD